MIAELMTRYRRQTESFQTMTSAAARGIAETAETVVMTSVAPVNQTLSASSLISGSDAWRRSLGRWSRCDCQLNLMDDYPLAFEPGSDFCGSAVETRTPYSYNFKYWRSTAGASYGAGNL